MVCPQAEDTEIVLGDFRLMSQALSSQSTVVAVTDQVSSDLAGEMVILGLESGRYYMLDEVGADIWKLIQQPTTVSSVRDAILAEYEVEREQCDKDILELLEKLAAAQLVIINNEPSA
jgi:hypothetical protein